MSSEAKPLAFNAFGGLICCFYRLSLLLKLLTALTAGSTGPKLAVSFL